MADIRMERQLAIELFAGRRDIIGTHSGGRYRSVRTSDAQYETAVTLHFEGKQRLAVYPAAAGDTVTFAVIDFDSHERNDNYKTLVHMMCFTLAERMRADSLHCCVEVSKSGFGNYHLWLFFTGPVPAALVRRMLLGYVQTYIDRYPFGIPNVKIGFELFPMQDRLNGTAGRCINVPYFPPDAAKGLTVFVDKNLKPVPLCIQRTDPKALEWAAASMAAEAAQPADERGAERTPSTAEHASAEHASTIHAPDGHVPAEQVSADFLAPAPKGQRANTLTRLVGHFKGKKLDKADTLGIAMLWNSRLREPLSEAEITRTVNSLYRSAAAAGEKPFQFNIIPGGRLAVMQIPERRDLVRGLFREKSLNFLSGEPKGGKSLLGMNLGLSVATGAPKFLDWEVEKSGVVLYINNELYFEDFGGRIQSMIRALPGTGPLDNFIAPVEAPPLTECFDQLNELCAQRKPVLVIIDCLYLAHNARENDASEMKAFMRQLQSLRDEHATCILVIHHNRKAVQGQRLHADQMRGAGVFRSIADTVAMLKPSETVEGKRIFAPVDLRHAGNDKGVRLLSLDTATLWFRDEGQTEEYLHIAAAPQAPPAEPINLEEFLEKGREMSRADLLAACRDRGHSRAAVDRALRRAKDRGVIRPVDHGRSYLIPSGQEFSPVADSSGGENGENCENGRSKGKTDEQCPF